MIFKTLTALVAMTGAAFAMQPTPTPETVPPPGLTDASEPGSVLVFPFFQAGSTPMFPGTAGAFTAARSVFEITAKCPDVLSPDVGGPGCVEQTLVLHAHWVCPGVPSSNGLPSICPESDFIRTVTFGSFAEGTVTFNPSSVPNPKNSDYNGSLLVPPAPCQQGFLIVYVEDSTGNPVKFDGLIGDARIANTSGIGFSSYSAVAIQADPAMPNWEKSNDGTTGPRMALGPAGSLVFDGAPQHYLRTVGQASGEVNWVSEVHAPFTRDKLIFMTLDVKSGLPNDLTFVPINFFNKYEEQHSDGVAFVCWGIFQLDTDISNYLTVEGFGSDNGGNPGAPSNTGNFRTDQAFDFTTGRNVTLLGIEKSNLGGDPQMITAAQLLRELKNNSIGVPTSFFPKQ